MVDMDSCRQYLLSKPEHDAKDMSLKFYVLSWNHNPESRDKLELLDRIPGCTKLLSGTFLRLSPFCQLCDSSGCTYYQGAYFNKPNRRSTYHVGGYRNNEL